MDARVAGQRMKGEEREGGKAGGRKSQRTEKGTSLGARANTRAPVRSLIIFPVAAEGKVAASGCYPRANGGIL